MIKIKEYQENRSLIPDGIIGPNTLADMRKKFGKSKEQIANFMGQLHHETGGFKYDTESLNYSAGGLISIFSYYKTRPMEAVQDGRTNNHEANQKNIANKVYWDRNRNESHKLGNEKWGDGWKYRGRGAIMVTGAWNYSELGAYVYRDLHKAPELVSTEYYLESALWFFHKRNLWPLCEEVSDKRTSKVTVRLNGGYNGIKERIRWTKRYLYLQNR